MAISWLQRLPAPFQLRSRFMKEVVENIKNGGFSNHSAQGSTLYYVIDACEREGISYQLTAYPGYGYGVQGIKNPYQELKEIE